MPTPPILLKNARVFTQEGFIQKDLYVKNGKIEALADPIGDSTQVIDATDYVVSPGFIDLHVHLREPGFSYKETIYTGTLAGAKGGFATLCAMPNLNPAPDNPDHLAMEQALIDQSAQIEVLPYATITKEEKGTTLSPIKELAPMAVGFSDDGKGVQSEALLLTAMEQIKQSGSFMAAHCEDENHFPPGGCVHDGLAAQEFKVVGIPSISEWNMIARDIALVEKTGMAYHVCHISTKEGVALVREAKAKGLPVSCECTPHQIALCEEDITQDEGRFKMNPPLRTRKDRAAIIQGLLDGTIDVIATDHAPHSQQEKSKGLAASAFGVVGLETAFGVCYTALVKTGLCSLDFLLNKFTFAPAKLLHKAIDLCPGAPANFTLIDPNATWQVKPAEFLSMGRSSPFSGQWLKGGIAATFYKGKPVYSKGGLL